MDSIMKQACDLAMPRVKRNDDALKSVYWWSDDIGEARKECIRWYRRWKREIRKNNAQIANHAHGKYRDSRKELRRLIRKSKREAWRELILTIDKDPWGMPYKIVMNKLKGGIPPLTETLKVETLDSTLTKLFPRALLNPRQELLNADGILWSEENDVTDIEIFRILKKGNMKNNTAPGPDGIRSLYWKRVNGIMMNALASSLTLCIKEGTFPEQWKVAHLVLLPKGPISVE